jgi:hypothetical protein
MIILAGAGWEKPYEHAILVPLGDLKGHWPLGGCSTMEGPRKVMQSTESSERASDDFMVAGVDMFSQVGS